MNKLTTIMSNKVVKLSSIIFRHQSQDFFKTLKPIEYSKIAILRQNEEYMRFRKEYENSYHQLLPNHDKNQSFLYATVVGYHKMKHPSTYPGYTYYFNLSSKQIKNTIFEIVDTKYKMEPMLGLKGLEKAMTIWENHNSKFESYSDPVVEGIIFPRIEVVIPYPVFYSKFVNQIEDRE